MKVALLPVGALPRGLLQGLADRLARFGIVGEVRTQVPVPSHASGKGAAQLRAEALLRLASNRSEDILAVTGKDLCAEGYGFVFGYANVGSSGAVVSVARLRHPEPDQLLDRS